MANLGLQVTRTSDTELAIAIDVIEHTVVDAVLGSVSILAPANAPNIAASFLLEGSVSGAAFFAVDAAGSVTVAARATDREVHAEQVGRKLQFLINFTVSASPPPTAATEHAHPSPRGCRSPMTHPCPAHAPPMTIPRHVTHLSTPHAPQAFTIRTVVDGAFTVVVRERLRVTVTVTDINDQTPTFSQLVYRSRILESTSNTDVLTVVATDGDLAGQPQSAITYAIVSDGSVFAVNAVSGVFRIGDALDFEEDADRTSTITIRASDAGVPSLFSDCTVVVTLVDENDNVPVFASIADIVLVRKSKTYFGTRFGRKHAKTGETPLPYTNVDFVYRLFLSKASLTIFTVFFTVFCLLRRFLLSGVRRAHGRDRVPAVAAGRPRHRQRVPQQQRRPRSGSWEPQRG